jgi:hypothetical protein
MSASIAGIAPLVAQAFGLQSLFLIGAALYLVILPIPVFAAAGRPARALAALD